MELSIIFEIDQMKIRQNMVRLIKIFLEKLYLKYFVIFEERKSGSIAIVTGGARGIGAEVVKAFLKLDMTVIIGNLNQCIFAMSKDFLPRAAVELSNL